MRGAGWWRSGCGRSQQLGQERILLSYRFIADHRALTVARRRHQGDDAAPLEEAQDAFARALDDGLEVFLGRCRRSFRVAGANRCIRSRMPHVPLPP